jgi:hypothetical protein
VDAATEEALQMTDLTPESEALLASIAHNERLSPRGARIGAYRDSLAAIEAIAIARDREGLAGLYEYGAYHTHDCANDQPGWRGRCPVAKARRLLALDAPEATR